MHKTIPHGAFYYGTSIFLLSTIDKEGNTNISPLSSSFSLLDNIVIGIYKQSKGFANLLETPEAVINFLPETLAPTLDKIEKLSGHHIQNKFEIAGLTPQTSTLVKPLRILESPLQAEVSVAKISDLSDSGFALIEFKIKTVHANEDILFDETRIDPNKWKPLIYNFRHYYGLTESKGKNFKAYC
ncbi:MULTISPECIES: flavin reductase family protein [Rodentibacter]|uniref:flavin reductase family protein n=1 Tax=Rodentibacter TaxID=1960084 RepID=UPI001CFEDE29|nr:flavin reductase [Rodentibacter sp. JRC1]GJI55420.1 hypothetical protein HEMROJRC1_05320 [Rodentibacter sp. JRC1]